MAGEAGAIKRELIVTRLSRRLGLKEETVWDRLEELRAQRRKAEEREARPDLRQPDEGPQQAPAPLEERQLVQILLAEAALVGEASEALSAEEVTHPGLKRVVEELYTLHRAGEPATLDQLRVRIPSPGLAQKMLDLAHVGRQIADRPGYLRKILAVFRERRAQREKVEISNQLHAVSDHGAALELLRQLQNQPGL